MQLSFLRLLPPAAVTAAALFALSPHASAQGSSTWRPPTGIPAPSFGIVEDVSMYLAPSQTFDYADDTSGPVAYRVADGLPYTHYVDNTAAGATDTDNPHGSPARPRLTWPYPLPEGAAVQLHGGPYNFSNAPSRSLAFGGAGTRERPIFVYSTAARPMDAPQIARDAYHWGNFTIVERLRFTNSATFSTRPMLKGAPVVKPVYRHLYMSGTGAMGNPSPITSGGSSGTSAATGTEGLVAWDNEIFGYGDWTAAAENDATGFILSQYCENAWVVDNVVYHMGGDGIRIGADQGDARSGSHYYVGRNVFHHNRENGLDVKQADHAVISENVMYGFAPSSSDPGTAVVVHYAPTDIWLINNELYDTPRGVTTTGIGDVMWIVGNRIHDAREYALYPARGGGTVRIFNNTIYASANAIVSTGAIAGLELRNNVIYGISGNILQVDDSGVRAASTASNELYFAGTGSLRIVWGATYTSVAAWVAGTSVGDGSLEMDPRILDAQQHLAEGSPALGAGYDWLAADTMFTARFGVTSLRDFDGDVRGLPLDLGADQRSGGTIPTPTDAGVPVEEVDAGVDAGGDPSADAGALVPVHDAGTGGGDGGDERTDGGGDAPTRSEGSCSCSVPGSRASCAPTSLGFAAGLWLALAVVGVRRRTRRTHSIPRDRD